MSTPVLIILALGAAFACWAALTLMGGERARRLHQLKSQRLTPPATTLLSVDVAPAGIAQGRPSAKPKSGKPKAAVPTKNVR